MNEVCQNTFDAFNDHEIVASHQTKKAQALLVAVDKQIQLFDWKKGRGPEHVTLRRDDYNTLKISVENDLKKKRSPERPNVLKYRGVIIKSM